MSVTVAVLYVPSPESLEWLGHMPVVCWAADRLREARGIDRVVCVAPPNLAARTASLLRDPSVPVVSVPVDSSVALEDFLCAAHGPAADADVVVVVEATRPFLSAASIEMSADDVVRGVYDACLAVRPHPVRSGPCLRYEVSPAGFRSFSPSRRCVDAKRRKVIDLGRVEGLDVRDADDFMMAKALVSVGNV